MDSFSYDYVNSIQEHCQIIDNGEIHQKNPEIMSQIESKFKNNLVFFLKCAVIQRIDNSQDQGQTSQIKYPDTSYIEQHIADNFVFFQEINIILDLPFHFYCRIIYRILENEPSYLLLCKLQGFIQSLNSLFPTYREVSIILETIVEDMLSKTPIHHSNNFLDFNIPKKGQYQIHPKTFKEPYIHDYAFANTYLTSITCDKNCQFMEIGSHAFESLSLTEVLDISIKKDLCEKNSTATVFKDNWCAGTPSLSRITVSKPNNRFKDDNRFLIDDSLHELLFYDRKSIPKSNKVIVPSSIETIRENSFAFCKKVQTIEFEGESQLKKIEHDAFSFSSLQTLKLPKSLEKLDDDWCNSTKHLTKIDLPSDNPHFSCSEKAFLFSISLDRIYFASRNLITITIPNSVTSIASYSFQHCDQLRDVIIHDDSQLREIGKSAFSGCKALEAINIPSHVSSIHSSAFYNCINLGRIIIASNDTITIDDYCFHNCTKLLYVVFPNAKKIDLRFNCFPKEYHTSENVLTRIFINRWTELTGDGVKVIKSCLYPYSNMEYMNRLLIPDKNLSYINVLNYSLNEIDISCTLEAVAEALYFSKILDNIENNEQFCRFYINKEKQFSVFYEQMETEIVNLIPNGNNSDDKMTNVYFDIINQIFNIVETLTILPVTIRFLSIDDFMVKKVDEKYVVKFINFGLYQIENALVPHLISQHRAQMMRKKLSYIPYAVLNGEKYTKEDYFYALGKIILAFFPEMEKQIGPFMKSKDDYTSIVALRSIFTSNFITGTSF